MSDWFIEFETPAQTVIAAPLAAIVLAALLTRLIRGDERAPTKPRAAVIVIWVAAIAIGAACVLLRPHDERLVRASLIILSVALPLLIFRTYSLAGEPAAGRLRRVFSGLRCAAALLLLLTLARPTLTLTGERDERPALTVLVNRSRSLLVRDAAGEPAGRLVRRVDALSAEIARQVRRRIRLAAVYNVAYSGFDAALRKNTEWAALADGDATGMAIALSAAADIADAQPAAVLLISDGAENIGSESDVLAAAQRWADQGVSIHAVGVGSDPPAGEARQLAVRAIAAPPTAVLGGEVAVQADVAAAGYAGATVRVELLWDDETVGTQFVTPSSPRWTAPVRFMHTARSGGFHRVEIRAAVSDPAAPAGADARAASSQVRHVHVADEFLNVLAVEAHPRTEAAFLVRALAGDHRFRVTTVLTAPSDAATNRSALPRTVPQWGAYQLVVLGDLDRGDVPRTALESLAQAVSRKGVGLIALGGLRRLGALKKPPLDALSPVDFFAADSPWRDVRLVPTPAGLRHPIGRLSTAGDAASQRTQPSRDDLTLWKSLPASTTATRLGAAKPATEVFVADERREPLIVGASVGRGRVGVVGIDDTWRWCMKLDDGRSLHAQFWRQIALWAADRRPSAYIRAEQPRFEWRTLSDGRKAIEIEARVADPLTGLPPDDMTVTAVMRGPLPSTQPAGDFAPQTPIALARRGDRWIGACKVPGVGRYSLHLTARRQDESGADQSPPRPPAAGAVPPDGAAPPDERLGQDRPITADGGFDVVDTDVERENPATDFDLLRRVADATAAAGGRFYTLDELGDCLDRLLTRAKPRRIATQRRIDLCGDYPWHLFAAITGLLCLEWALRKRAAPI